MDKDLLKNNPELSAFLEKLTDVPDFQGVRPTEIDQRSILGDTPLHFAAKWGETLVGQKLIEAGADLNAKGEYGNTPLHYAVGLRKYEFAKMLLSRGASRHVADDFNQTPEEVALQLNDACLKRIFA